MVFNICIGKVEKPARADNEISQNILDTRRGDSSVMLREAKHLAAPSVRPLAIAEA
jgi:hypothetical protein